MNIFDFFSSKFVKTKVIYSFVVDADSKFELQSKILVKSLIKFGKVNPSDIYAQFTPQVKHSIKENLLQTGINALTLEEFGSSKYCNKINQAIGLFDLKFDFLMLLDTDLVVLGPLQGLCKEDHISGKTVDFENPKIQFLDMCFQIFGIQTRPKIVNIDLDSLKYTYSGNFNGGLYIIPYKYLYQLYQSWRDSAITLLKDTQVAKHKVLRHHVDQVSLCIATHKIGAKLNHLDRSYNFPTHVKQHFDKRISVIHYHKLNDNNLIENLSSHSKMITEAIHQANKLIKGILNSPKSNNPDPNA